MPFVLLIGCLLPQQQNATTILLAREDTVVTSENNEPVKYLRAGRKTPSFFGETGNRRKEIMIAGKSTNSDRSSVDHYTGRYPKVVAETDIGANKSKAKKKRKKERKRKKLSVVVILNQISRLATQRKRGKRKRWNKRHHWLLLQQMKIPSFHLAWEIPGHPFLRRRWRRADRRNRIPSQPRGNTFLLEMVQ